MEELGIRHKQLLQAYKRLSYMVKTFKELSQNKNLAFPDQENEYIVHRDALIKRFEFCYDLTWKFFKLLLKLNYSIDVTSPRKVFQECYQQGIITLQQIEYLLAIIEIRNQTTHVYDEEMAQVMSSQIVESYSFLRSIIDSITY